MSFLLALGAHGALAPFVALWLHGSADSVRLDLADGETPLEVTLQMVGPPTPVAVSPPEPAPVPAEPMAIAEPVPEKMIKPVTEPAPVPAVVPKRVLTEPAPTEAPVVPPAKPVNKAPVEAHVDRVNDVGGMDATKTSAPATVTKSEAGKGTGPPASGSRPAGQAGGPAPLSSIFPRYPMGARLRGEEGPVRLRARVDGRGWPVEVTVVESSGFFALDAAAVKAVKGARFVAPGPNAPPESFEAELTIRFQLKDP